MLKLIFCTSSSYSPSMPTTFYWFRVNPNQDIITTQTKTKNTPLTLSPVCSMPLSTPTNFISLPSPDSKIYALHGINNTNFELTRKVLVCDFGLANIHPSWKKLHSLKLPVINQYSAAVSSFNGNLFVLGILNAQVFNPSSNSLTQFPISSLPKSLGQIISSVFVADRNELLFFSNYNDSVFVYSLNMDSCDWKRVFVDGLRPNWCLGKPVAVGDVVYVFVKMKLYAFDLSMDTPSLEVVSGAERELSLVGDGDGMRMAYIGYRRLCFVSARLHSDGFLHLVFSKFVVATCIREGRFQALADFDGQDEYIVEGNVLHDCLTI